MTNEGVKCFGEDKWTGSAQAALGLEEIRGLSLFKAVLLNAAGYTHTSIAIDDAIKSIKVPVIEVHLSDSHKREEFRHLSFVSMVAVACFAGHGAKSYTLALDAAAKL